MTRSFPLCSHHVPGLFPVQVVENSGHGGLFPVFPSIAVIGARTQGWCFCKFSPHLGTWEHGEHDLDSIVCDRNKMGTDGGLRPFLRQS